ncbi:Uma2 family endonuclease [Streptomyces antnestii]|uniref:Uma2 family endonuclease n=1 Tax=Streptomyces antnestii TaxID=2494256 RepID=A0A437P7L6_9ACTN|nr:Uma2 family endonuclease [Streptomyces sp. San01]RVU18286.1 Uma2 family endonuclease [Streptomyces sp. San01]
MSAASVERPAGDRPLTAEANRLMDRNPGYRVEIIGGQILVTPPADGAHARALTKLMRPFITAGLDDGETSVVQAIGLWLPTGAEDYAIPDLALVEADFESHLIENNCYDPIVFRLALEVTSSNYRADLRTKVAAYADAKIPVYVIVDRKHQRLHVLTEPESSAYDNHQVHAPGETVALPKSIGAEVILDVDALLKASASQAQPE